MWNPGEDGGATVEHEPEALEAVKMLVELGNDVRAVNDRGETALHGAAYRGAPSIADYLVEQGAQLDARSVQGWTPWTIANGVFYSLFYKEQPAAADRLAELMAARGMSTEGMADALRTCFDCGRNRGNARDAEGRRVAQPTPDGVPSRGRAGRPRKRPSLCPSRPDVRGALVSRRGEGAVLPPITPAATGFSARSTGKWQQVRPAAQEPSSKPR